jgi:hypothetical protein
LTVKGRPKILLPLLLLQSLRVKPVPDQRPTILPKILLLLLHLLLGPSLSTADPDLSLKGLYARPVPAQSSTTPLL